MRPGWTVEKMEEWISNMIEHWNQEYYQLYHYEDIGRFCSNNHIPNIDHRWYFSEDAINENIDQGFLKRLIHYTNEYDKRSSRAKTMA